MNEYIGICPCGQVEVWLVSQLRPDEFQPRSDAPTCAFCRQHNGVWISDPKGTLRLRAANATRVERFGSEQVAFHFCVACGGLVYAAFEDGGRVVAVVRVGILDRIRRAALPTVTTNFEGETLPIAARRRLERWTPIEWD